MNSNDPFKIIKAISETKNDAFSSLGDEAKYPSFIVNRGLSYFPDTILYAQTLNFFADLDSKLQYDYLINTIKPRKRYSGPWPKLLRDDDIEVIKEFFQVNTQKAKSIKSILTNNQLAEIKEQQKELSGNNYEQRKSG